MYLTQAGVSGRCARAVFPRTADVILTRTLQQAEGGRDLVQGQGSSIHFAALVTRKPSRMREFLHLSLILSSARVY